jgi:hypothetical protein
LKKWITDSKNQERAPICPIDSTLFDDRALKPDNNLRAKVLSLELFCPNGCKEIVTLENLEQHKLEDCENLKIVDKAIQFAQDLPLTSPVILKKSELALLNETLLSELHFMCTDFTLLKSTEDEDDEDDEEEVFVRREQRRKARVERRNLLKAERQCKRNSKSCMNGLSIREQRREGEVESATNDRQESVEEGGEGEGRLVDIEGQIEGQKDDSISDEENMESVTSESEESDEEMKAVVSFVYSLLKASHRAYSIHHMQARAHFSNMTQSGLVQYLTASNISFPPNQSKAVLLEIAVANYPFKMPKEMLKHNIMEQKRKNTNRRNPVSVGNTDGIYSSSKDRYRYP